MKSPTSKTIPGPALLFKSKLRFRQRAGHRAESGSRLTRNPSCLEVAGRRRIMQSEMGNGLGAIAILEISNKVEASLERFDSLESY
jgi:hypothetical protein